MRRQRLGVVVGGLVLIGGLVAGGHLFTLGGSRSEEASRGEARQAATVYLRACAGCHGVRGDGGIGPSLLGVGTRLSRSRIERIIRRGKGHRKPVPMPGGLVSDEEAALLADWQASRAAFPLVHP